MKNFLIGIIVLGSFSSFAGTDVTPSLEETLAKQTCVLSVVNRPIDFDKGSSFTNTGRVYIQAKLLGMSDVRRLAVGRSIIISGIEKAGERILLNDKSIYSICVDVVQGNDDCEFPGKLTLREIEEYSDFNFKINCSKDNVVLF